MPGLGNIVRRRPLASMVVGGDCYSLGYSVAREPVSRAVARIRLRLELTSMRPGQAIFGACG